MAALDGFLGCSFLYASLLVLFYAAVTLRSSKDLPSRQENSRNMLLDSAFPFHLYHAQQEPYRSYRCLPRRLHVAQRSNVIQEKVSMTVSFMLDSESCREDVVLPLVLYGRTGKQHDAYIAVPNEPLQFNYSSSKTIKPFQSDLIFHVELPDLQAGMEHYWYRITVVDPSEKDLFIVTANRRRLLRGQPKILVQTKTYTFQTPPLHGSPTRLALVGDLGQTNNSTRTMHRIWRASIASSLNPYPVSQLLIAGDLSYADSDPYRWVSWFDLMEPLFRNLPLHVAAGNHEIECDNNLEIFVPYENYFYNPNRVAATDKRPITKEYKNTLWRHSCSAPSQFQGTYNYGNSFYAYQHGLAHIIVLNSYTNAKVGSPQFTWLQHELQTVNRTLTPWLLVAFHAPLYTTFDGHVNELEANNMRTAMEPLFYESGVSFVVSGHDHAYMRTRPLYRERVDEFGTIYLTLGAGGNREQHAPGFRKKQPEAWVAQRTLVDYGFGDLLLQNATHAQFSWIADGIEPGGVHDQVWIYNRHAVR